MRAHALGSGALAGLVALGACGETLPVNARTPPDDAGEDRAAVDAAPDGGAAIDAEPAARCAEVPCGVVEIAPVRPRALAASAEAVAWLHADTVYSPDPDGGTALVVASTSAVATGFLALDAFTAFFAQAAGPRSCSILLPCGDDPGAPFFGFGDTGPLAVGSGELFAADRANARALGYCGAAQSCGQTPEVVAYLPAAATRMTLTTAHVVVAFADGPMRAYPRSGRVSGDAGAVSPGLELVAVDDLRGLAADGQVLYWTDGLAGNVQRCSLPSCIAETVHSNQRYPRAIAAAAGKLYWVETDGDAVVRCSAPACSDVTVIARVRRPVDLAVGARVYVVSETDQKIYAAPP